MEGTDICFAPVLSMSEAPNHIHNKERETFVEKFGVVQPNVAPRFSKTPSKIQGNTIENYLPFSSPLLDLIKKCKKEGVGFNEYGLDLSNPRIGIKKDVDAQVTSLPDGSLMIIFIDNGFERNFLTRSNSCF